MGVTSVDLSPGLLSVAIVVLVCLLWSSTTAGLAIGPEDQHQQTEADDLQSFALSQGNRCVELSAYGEGRRSISEQYDYRNPYTEPSSFRYASFGTKTIQRSNTSQLFVYHGRNGYSLVFIHDSLNGDRGGGTISANISGLPSSGQWVVEDDQYPERDDVFSHENGSSYIEWVWNSGNRTDGGAFRGLGNSDYQEISINMSFNNASAQYPFEKWSNPISRNRITAWIARSGTGVAYQLNMSQPVRLRPGTCDSPSRTRRPTITGTTTKSSTSVPITQRRTNTQTPTSTSDLTSAEGLAESTAVRTAEAASTSTQRSTDSDSDPTLEPIRTTPTILTETIAPKTTDTTTTTEQSGSSTEASTRSPGTTTQSSTVQRGSDRPSSATRPSTKTSNTTKALLESESPAGRSTARGTTRSETEKEIKAESSRTDILMYVIAGLIGGLMIAGIVFVHGSWDR